MRMREMTDDANYFGMAVRRGRGVPGGAGDPQCARFMSGVNNYDSNCTSNITRRQA